MMNNNNNNNNNKGEGEGEGDKEENNRFRIIEDELRNVEENQIVVNQQHERMIQNIDWSTKSEVETSIRIGISEVLEQYFNACHSDNYDTAYKSCRILEETFSNLCRHIRAYEKIKYPLSRKQYEFRLVGNRDAVIVLDEQEIEKHGPKSEQEQPAEE